MPVVNGGKVMLEQQNFVVDAFQGDKPAHYTAAAKRWRRQIISRHL